MSTYAVGDIQGCLDQLYQLLKVVDFKPKKDCLWVVGDLVNRGPDSLETLRFIKSLPNKRVVLGNHDLHLLAVAKGSRTPSSKDTFDNILQAKDRAELLDWLQSQPLMYHDEALGYSMVHAGIPPHWSISQAMSLAKEVEAILQSENDTLLFENMYGNLPDSWDESLKGPERLRVITNYFTRMRFCSAEGKLELDTKTSPTKAPEGFAPWFSHPNHQCLGQKILFGHWAALQGVTGSKDFTGLDTGCVWGGALSAYRLEDATRISIPCPSGLAITLNK